MSEKIAKHFVLVQDESYARSSDDESGLFYNYFRYYNPETGRYMRSDPIELGGGLNVFGYVGGSPLGTVDSNGLLEASWSKKLTLGSPSFAFTGFDICWYGYIKIARIYG